MHTFLERWRSFVPSQVPYLLPGDEVLGQPLVLAKHARVLRGWQEYLQDDECHRESFEGLHLGLLPMPFVGNPRTAGIFILSLNPGLAPMDYFAEYEVPGFRGVLINNLAQQDDGPGFFFLDPQYSWHTGYGYWHGKLRSTIRALGERLDLPYRGARELLQQQLCAIDLYPYHSTVAMLPDKIVRQLTSTVLARAFVKEVLIPRARAGNALVVVTRCAQACGVHSVQQSGMIVYQGAACRGAHLSPSSLGGSAVLDFLAAPGRAA